MKKFLQNKKLLSAFIIVIVVLVVLGGSVSLRKKRNTPLLIQSLGNDIVALGTRIVDIPVGWVSGGLNSAHDILNTQEENNHLKREVTNLGQTKVRNSALEKENKTSDNPNTKKKIGRYFNNCCYSAADCVWSF